MKIKNYQLSQVSLYTAWILSLGALFGSLYFSEVQRIAPCVLCWYQRILMYPLVIIIPIGILAQDKHIYRYVLPFSILGALIALYQVLLQEGILSENIAPCTLQTSCAIKYLAYFGFLTIPVMSLTAFVLITLCMLVFRKVR